MIHNTIVCAPDGLRDQLRSLTRMQLVRTLASWRPDLTAYRDLDSAYRIGLKSLARRYLELHDEIANLDVMIAALVDELVAILIARNSIGHRGAAQLLLTVGDNPERLRSEASFASLCGVSPVPASSGKTVRHRLNRGGDRAANSALHIIAIGRLRTDQELSADKTKRAFGERRHNFASTGGRVIHETIDHKVAVRTDVEGGFVNEQKLNGPLGCRLNAFLMHDPRANS